MTVSFVVTNKVILLPICLYARPRKERKKKLKPKLLKVYFLKWYFETNVASDMDGLHHREHLVTGGLMTKDLKHHYSMFHCNTVKALLSSLSLLSPPL